MKFIYTSQYEYVQPPSVGTMGTVPLCESIVNLVPPCPAAVSTSSPCPPSRLPPICFLSYLSSASTSRML